MNKKDLISFFKHQTIVIYISLFVVVLGTIMVSSAIYTKTQNSNSPQTIKTGNFMVAFDMGSTIQNKIYIATDNDGDKYSTPYTFKVTNNGNITSSYAIILKIDSIGANINKSDIRYKLDSNAYMSLTSNSNYNNDSNSYKIGDFVLKNNEHKDHSLRVILAEGSYDSAISQTLKLSVQVIAVPPEIKNFDYTGGEQTFTVPYTGTYTITAVGAEGGVGNTYGNEGTLLKGGKGAKISADFELKAGDVLTIIVGGQGQKTPNSTSKDGASGAGGGGSFVFKKISSVSNTNYQVSKNGTNYETLLVAAGGSGTADIGENSGSYSSHLQGYDGNGENYYSSSTDKYKARSTAVYEPSSASGTSSVLGVDQFVRYNSAGAKYTRGSSTCTGGYGGGGCQDIGYGLGGGWCLGDKTNTASTKYTTYSWSIGSNTSGSNGANLGNGHVSIKLK